jgi:chorismate mutase
MPDEQPHLQRQLEKWMRAARAAGLADEAIAALVAEATESSKKEEP